MVILVILVHNMRSLPLQLSFSLELQDRFIITSLSNSSDSGALEKSVQKQEYILLYVSISDN